MLFSTKMRDKIYVRQVTEKDLDEIMEIERRVWPENMRATRDMLLSRLKTFPEGFLCVVKNGKIVGFVCSEIIYYKDTKKKNFNWYNLTDNGYITKSHNPKGDSLYGISLSVLPQNKDAKLASMLIFDSLGKLIIRKRLKRGVFGARIPSYYKYAIDFPIEKYIFTIKRNGFFLDPELALYQRIGIYPIRAIKDYFEDNESLNYGVLVTWKNPYYKITRLFPFLAFLLSKIWRAKLFNSHELMKIGKSKKYYYNGKRVKYKEVVSKNDSINLIYNR